MTEYALFIGGVADGQIRALPHARPTFVFNIADTNFHGIQGPMPDPISLHQEVYIRSNMYTTKYVIYYSDSVKSFHIPRLIDGLLDELIQGYRRPKVAG